MPAPFADPQSVMRRALELAARGRGHVEPNPPVGAVVVDAALNLVAEGFHRRFGGPHAEIDALQSAGRNARGATLFVTLEPCCHTGQTGPCTEAIIRAGLRKVVAAVGDPSPHAGGQGFAALRAAGIEVETGLLADEAARLAAPFMKLVTTGLPWVHAKWAMTLDGKIASRIGSSRWITGPRAREITHALRGRMDAIVVGAGTARRDDPLLTTRPPGPRVATRIVVDTLARLSPDSRLALSTDEAPLLVAAGNEAPAENVERLRAKGAEVLQFPSWPAASPECEPRVDFHALLVELGRRRMTNVLVEGGGGLLGTLFDQRLIDEAHAFIAPKIVGGSNAVTPIAGLGLAEIAEAAVLDAPRLEQAGDDLYLHGHVKYPAGGDRR